MGLQIPAPGTTKGTKANQCGLLCEAHAPQITAPRRKSALFCPANIRQGFRQMAYIRKRGNRWAVEVDRRGVTAHETFGTKTAAQVWARKIEADIDAAKEQS